jgi:hypothetical protein
MYAAVLKELSNYPSGKTAAQLATILNQPVKAITDVLTIMVGHGRAANNAGTYTINPGRRDK